ncbi:MlaD family protein [Paraconexibacter antarcticus]|uniref:MlaD family protein n=1 Tax=Paraconexibacter antarcticus TaxID=2949664 RepID=A0ABY5DV72_9ACTN|nr:MlaD family protein [Paraconexibacter antarcticus]UTI65913.1 MlaD family protein [Paraconexibacter antarcticus]
MGEGKVRGAALAAVGLVAIAILAVVLLGKSSHTMNIRFLDAGQLVRGDLVEVSGRAIGSVSDITLTNDNQANVKVKTKNDDFWPFKEGTVAGVRAVGLSGVANRYVEITPSATGADIPDGGTIRPTDTRTIVDLDEVLTALDAPTRAKLKRLIHEGADVFHGNAQDANDAIVYANPAIAQGSALLSEADRDEAAVGRLVSTAATVSTTLAQRRGALQGSITNTARTLAALAAERSALQDSLVRAPSTLRQAMHTLQLTRSTLTSVRPVLRELQPTAKPLAEVLRLLPTTGRDLRPAIGQLRDLIPALTKALKGVPALDKAARPALSATSTALKTALPIATGLRPYSPDAIAGLFNGFTGTTAGYYDANGHYARVPLITGPGALSGGLGSVAKTQLSTGNTARCPGGAVEPAGDKSNPYIPDPSLCNPAHDQK